MGFPASCAQHNWLFFSQTTGSPCPFSADRVTSREGLPIPPSLSQLGPQPRFGLGAQGTGWRLQQHQLSSHSLWELILQEGILRLLPPWWISFGEWGGPFSPLQEGTAAIICCCLDVFAVSWSLGGGWQVTLPTLSLPFQVEDGGKAALSQKMRSGDELVNINGTPLYGSRQEALILIKGSYRTLKMIIRR